MRINILVHELKQSRMSILVWVLSLIGVSVMFLGLYPALIKETGAFMEIIAAFPDAIKQLTGFTDAVFTSEVGYYGLAFTYITLFGSIQAMNLGLTILSKDDSAHTADFLLTKPVSRNQILISKLLAGLGVLIITNLILIPIEYFLMSQFFTSLPDLGVFLLTSLTLLYVQIFFLGMGFLTSSLLKRVKSGLVISLPVVFGFYIVGMLDSVVGKDLIRYFTPFKFFDFNYINTHRSYEWQFIFLGIAFVTAATFVGWQRFIKKDIQTL